MERNICFARFGANTVFTAATAIVSYQFHRSVLLCTICLDLLMSYRSRAAAPSHELRVCLSKVSRSKSFQRFLLHLHPSESRVCPSKAFTNRKILPEMLNILHRRHSFGNPTLKGLPSQPVGRAMYITLKILRVRLCYSYVQA